MKERSESTANTSVSFYSVYLSGSQDLQVACMSDRKDIRGSGRKQTMKWAYKKQKEEET